MKLEVLTEQHLLEIIKLYEGHCGFGRGFREAMYQTPSMILENLRRDKSGEYRVGSRWDGHSKIYFSIDNDGNVVIIFNSNFDPADRDGHEYIEAETAGEIFMKEARRYLDSFGS